MLPSYFSRVPRESPEGILENMNFLFVWLSCAGMERKHSSTLWASTGRLYSDTSSRQVRRTSAVSLPAAA